MDRQHRRDLKHDKFVDEMGTLSQRARDNQRVLTTLAGAAVLIALVAYGVYFYRSNREQKAQDALADAITTIDAPLVDPAAKQQNPLAKFKTNDERIASAEKLFKGVRDNFSGTDAADVADLYLARISGTHGDTAGSRKMLEEFIRKHPKNLLVGAARYSLYELRIENGEAPQVASELNQELARNENQVLPPDSMLVLLAHAYDAQGISDKSRDAYRRIVSQFPDSPDAVEAQRKVGPA
ncbi:MAG: tetratricopeptide repeat protein [Thermoanaerobaculia bacterium]